MPKRAATLFVLALLVSAGFAKDKSKNTLPAYVLSAHTIAVVIDPHAGMSIDDPQANEVARKDVEAALLSWGRFEPVVSTQSADLIIVLRKGNGHPVNETIPNGRQNNRPGSISSADNGIEVGAQHGRSPDLSGDPGPGSNPGSNQDARGPQMEIGEADDSFTVFQGNVERPLDTPPGWRYFGKDGLHPYTVPAVAAFRQAVEKAEKASAKKP
jgi:hypothetical protein